MKKSSFIHPSYAPAPRSDGMDIDHGKADRVSSDFFFTCKERLTIFNKTDLGTRPTDVESN
jgi:hypothetical protein